MREIRTLRAMRRGLETAYGTATEALPKETGSQQLGRAYGEKRQSSTLPGLSASAYRGLSTKSFIGANRIGPLPEPEPTAYTFTTSVSCFQWVPLLSQRGFDFSTTSVGQA